MMAGKIAGEPVKCECPNQLPSYLHLAPPKLLRAWDFAGEPRAPTPVER